MIEYTGRGYFQGVPARDLTTEEWKAIPPQIKKALLKSGLYKVKRNAKKSTASPAR